MCSANNESLIDRINELAKKSKSEGLTQAEIEERDILRKKYIENFRAKFKNEILDNIYLVDEDGTKTKLTEE